MIKICVKNPDNLVNPVKDRPGKISCRVLKHELAMRRGRGWRCALAYC